jgi:hypothetical protein
MTVPADEAFLARWSRKAADRRGEPTDASETEADAAPEPAAPEPPELPDLATLDGRSDYRPFLRAGVPPELRRDALRTLWRTNPIINSLDGLDDHYVTQDFTDRSTVMANLRTVYRVGKGMLDAVERLDTQTSIEAKTAGPEEPARLETGKESEVEPVTARALAPAHEDPAGRS